MCTSSNCPHGDDNLDDDFSDIFGGEPLSADDIAHGVDLARNQQVRGLVEETCKACNGSGKFYGYTGRLLGDCFKCKGKGKRYFKSTLAQREKATDQRKARAVRDSAAAIRDADAWIEANPAEGAWINDASARGFEFAVSLRAALYKYGYLTEKQEAAVRNATAKSVARQAQWQAERAERDANKADVEISRIADAFAAAKASGLRYPKLYLSDFTFSPASESSRNAGSIYVKQGDLYLGKVAEGKFTRSRDCTAEVEAEIVAVCADPSSAAVAYGKRTGRCSCCGRELTNALSIELGIGPICRGKWGWA
jgi:hypothetical protein